MTDLYNKKKRNASITVLKNDLSHLTDLIKSINIKRDLDDKMKGDKINQYINPDKCTFISSRNLSQLSSFDTIEKKKSISKKLKNYRSKSISQRIVIKYNKNQNEDSEDNTEHIEKEKIDLLSRNIYRKGKDILTIACLSRKKKPKIEVVKSSRNRDDTKPDHYLSLPDTLKKEIDILSIKIIYPIDNKSGKFTKYVQNVAKSIKDYQNLDYDSIFSPENEKNIKYYFYENPINNENSEGKKLLLLDLDETLIHSEFRDSTNYKSLDKMKEKSKCYNRSFSYVENNYRYYFDIYFRPFLFDFLHEIKNYFDLAIFTASSKGYADAIINYIDPKNEFFKFRLYRDACIPIHKYLYIKDLRIIKNYNPKKIILMDNSLYSFINQPSNGMLIYSFYSNHKDNQLINAKNFLIKYIYPSKDLRVEIEKWFHFCELLGKKFPPDCDSDSEDY